jgi:Ni/Co efflux regulator RcnB
MEKTPGPRYKDRIYGNYRSLFRRGAKIEYSQHQVFIIDYRLS